MSFVTYHLEVITIFSVVTALVFLGTSIQFYRRKKVLQKNFHDVQRELQNIQKEIQDERRLYQEKMAENYKSGFKAGLEEGSLIPAGITREQLNRQIDAEKNAAYEQGRQAGSNEVFNDFKIEVMPTFSVEQHYFLFFRSSMEADIGFRAQWFYRRLPIFESMNVILYQKHEVRTIVDAANLASQLAAKAFAFATGGLPSSLIDLRSPLQLLSRV